MIEGQHALERPGTVYPLGKYIVLAELGRGGMAEVYLALSRGPSGFSKLVVLKLLRAHLAEDETFLRMFLAEARLAARLNHANIVQTYEIGLEAGRSCIVMEYLEGRSLAELEAAAKHKPMPLNFGVRVLADVLAGLHYAHERCDVHGQPLGLVHRDVSPHNVIVTYDGQVKLLDFGIAKAADDGGHTKTGVFKGKLRYTAPERFCSEESDRRSDIFSVGVMLWQLLAKRPLWHGMTELALMHHLANKTPVPSPRTIDPEIPARLEEICMKAVAMSAADRFQTAAEMQDALEEFLAGDSVGMTSRALGRYMNEVFGATRARFQRTVDEQLRAAAEMPNDSEVSISMSRVRTEGVPLLVADEAPDSRSGIPLTSSSSRMRAALVASSAAGMTEPSPVLEIVSSRPSPAGRRWAGPAALAVLLAVVSTVLLLRLRTNPAPPTPALTPGAAANAAPPAGTVTPSDPSALATPAPATATGATALSDSAAATLPPTDTPGVADAPRAAGGGVKRAPVGATAPSRAPAARGHANAPAVDSRAPAPAPENEPAKREVDCSSPYFIDDQGMKKIRPECL